MYSCNLAVCGRVTAAERNNRGALPRTAGRGARGDHDQAREATIVTRIFPHGCAPAPRARPPQGPRLVAMVIIGLKTIRPYRPHPRRTSDPFQILILLETSDIRIHTKIARHLDSLHCLSHTRVLLAIIPPPHPQPIPPLSRHVTVSPSWRGNSERVERITVSYNNWMTSSSSVPSRITEYI